MRIHSEVFRGIYLKCGFLVAVCVGGEGEGETGTESMQYA